jgi:tRNA(adenine34) deaminase
MQNRDEEYMQQALLEAQKAFIKNEVPVGAVAVFKGEIIARAHNEVETLQDASAHAELLCLKRAAEVLGGWRLLGVTLYSTLEPCCLCAGAIFSFRIERVVWAAPDIRLGADGSWMPILSSSHPLHKVEVQRGVLSEPSAQLLREFFRKQRSVKIGKNI